MINGMFSVFFLCLLSMGICFCMVSDFNDCSLYRSICAEVTYCVASGINSPVHASLIVMFEINSWNSSEFVSSPVSQVSSRYKVCQQYQILSQTPLPGMQITSSFANQSFDRFWIRFTATTKSSRRVLCR